MSNEFEAKPVNQEDTTSQQYEKGSEAFQNLASYLEELGLFSIKREGEPLSLDEAKAFRDSLTPEQRKKLDELESAYEQS